MKKLILSILLSVVVLTSYGQAPYTKEQIGANINANIRGKTYSEFRMGNLLDSLKQSLAFLSGSYSNPSWITSLGWSKITGAPGFITNSYYTFTNGLTELSGSVSLGGVNPSWSVGTATPTDTETASSVGAYKDADNDFAYINWVSDDLSTEYVGLYAGVVDGIGNGMTFVDNRLSKRGIEYAGDGYVTQTLSLTNKGYVDTQVATKMANPMTTLGDLIVGNSAGIPGRLGIGTAGQSLRVNSGATALEYFNVLLGSTGSVDNSILRADGTNGYTLQSSPFSIADNANTTYGTSSTSGSFREFIADGSATDVGFHFKGKGTTNFYIGDSGSNSALLQVFGNLYAVDELGITPSGSGGNVYFRVQTSTVPVANTLNIEGHTSADVGNIDGGDVVIKSGTAVGSGIDGDITLNPGTGNISFTKALPITSGGTASTTKNFVDLTTTQSVSGNKTFDPTGLRVNSGGLAGYTFTAANTNAQRTITLPASDGTLMLSSGLVNAGRIPVVSSTQNVMTSSNLFTFVSNVLSTPNLTLSNGLVTPPTAFTTTATLSNENIITTNGTFTLTLPAAASNNGRQYVIKNIGTGTITIDGNASETIDGQLTQQMTMQYEYYWLVCNGTAWFVLNQ